MSDERRPYSGLEQKDTIGSCPISIKIFYSLDFICIVILLIIEFLSPSWATMPGPHAIKKLYMLYLHVIADKNMYIKSGRTL